MIGVTIFGQNSAFWFILGQKMCSSTLDMISWILRLMWTDH